MSGLCYFQPGDALPFVRGRHTETPVAGRAADVFKAGVIVHQHAERAGRIALEGKDGEIGEDDLSRAEKSLDGTTRKYVDGIDDLLKHKEAELLEI